MTVEKKTNTPNWPENNLTELLFQVNLSWNGITTESNDVSGVVGLGLDLPLGFRVDGRYNFGLTEVFPDLADVKNQVFSLSIGWTLL